MTIGVGYADDVGTIGKIGNTTSKIDAALPDEVGSFLNNSWSKGTFANKTQSVKYHLNKHGKSRFFEASTKLLPAIYRS
ncbi:MAG: hypothetical protein PF692_07875 [Kiritimatiellae bacterium]|nr:hypothetical protein [Kiritimatiellia bacterium]